MSALEELLAIEKEISEKRGMIDELVNKMIDEESKKLGEEILGEMGTYGDDEARDEGFNNAYIAMCYQMHYIRFHSYDQIYSYMKYSSECYELPEELRELLCGENAVPEYNQYGEPMEDEVTSLEEEIREKALCYAMSVIREDYDTADREAMRRGEIDDSRQAEYEERNTFSNADEAMNIIDKAGTSLPYNSLSYKDLKENLFNYFGKRFVNRFIKRVIIRLKKKSAEEYRKFVDDEHHLLRTAWDVICVAWDDCYGSFPDELIKDESSKEYKKLNTEEKMLLWYFNTYKNNSCLEEYFDDPEKHWMGKGIIIDQVYEDEREEILDVITQRILWTAGEDSNYRIDFYRDDYTQEMFDEYFDPAEWDNETTEKMTEEYYSMFDEEFPLDPKTNRMLLIQCLASETPWSEETDLTIKIETPESKSENNNNGIGENNTTNDSKLSLWERRMSYFFPMIKDKTRIETKNEDGTPLPEGLVNIELFPDEDLEVLRKSALTTFAEKLDDIVQGLNWFIANDDGRIVIVWDNMIPVYGDVYVKTESLTDTAEQVSDMVKNLDTSIIFRQLVDFEGCDETGKPNNFYEIVRLTDAYEKDLKALSARLNEAVGEGDV